MRAIGYFSEPSRPKVSPKHLSADKADFPSANGGSTPDGGTPPEHLSELASPTNLSLSAQNDRFLHHCENNGYEAAAAFLDTAHSGARPG